MRQYLLDFLKRLEFLIQPPSNCHHAITFANYGSDDSGWKDKVAVQVNLSGKFHCFFLEDEDFAQPAEDIANEIAELVRNNPHGQLGIAMGQYLEP